MTEKSIFKTKKNPTNDYFLKYGGLQKKLKADFTYYIYYMFCPNFFMILKGM